MGELNNNLLNACRYVKSEAAKNMFKINLRTPENKDTRDNTTLNAACENYMPVDGIRCFHSEHPEDLAMHDDEGISPFHTLHFHGKLVENMTLSQGAHHVGLVTASENGCLPMH